MKILLHHIAKTAGSSLIDSIRRLHPDSTCEVRYDSELTSQLMLDEKYRFYHGHYSFDKVRQFKEIYPKLFTIVFLRHPYNRVISQYYNWIDEKRTTREFDVVTSRKLFTEDFIDAKRKQFAEIRKLTLLQFLSSTDPDVFDVCYNHQTRYLSEKSLFREDPTQGLFNAISNVKNFYDFVGLAEFYPESISTLSKLLGLDESRMADQKKLNTNSVWKVDGTYIISKEEHEKLDRLNNLDFALYTYALSHCEHAQLAEVDDPFRKLLLPRVQQ